MDTTATGHAEPNATPDAPPETQAKAQPKAQPKTAKSDTRPPAIDRYAEARLAKKKQRRRAHRLTIRRSNTNG